MPTLAMHIQAPGLGSRDAPIMKGFVERTDAALDSAHQTSGFVGRYQRYTGEFLRGPGPTTAIPDPGYPGLTSDSRTEFYAEYDYAATTLSIWTNLESVAAFSYRGLHAEALSKRSEWFAKTDYPIYAAWWLADDAPTPTAFDFKSPFDASGAPTKLDRTTLDQYAKTVR